MYKAKGFLWAEDAGFGAAGCARILTYVLGRLSLHAACCALFLLCSALNL